uniref:Uncharacterized protein n=1 Tax=Arundo donax TaxID=35708 RepID=A0A0A9G9C2_ARUDO
MRIVLSNPIASRIRPTSSGVNGHFPVSLLSL